MRVFQTYYLKLSKNKLSIINAIYMKLLCKRAQIFSI
ncbi:hypothetical protein Sbal223_1914 [Shewanella baltica OS223]|nr:hypothetical protein Sbal223_1914 [Shewanella baltica OS223]